MTPKFPHMLFSLALYSIVFFTTSACSGGPPRYSGDAGNFRFHIIEVKRLDALGLPERKVLSPQPGFIFLGVDLAVENKSNQVAGLAISSTSIKGRTGSGDYAYPESYLATDQPVSLGPIPPSVRFKISRIFEVAANTGDYRITINLAGGGLWPGPSTTITLPPNGDRDLVAFPYDSTKPTSLLKSGQSIPWFGNTTAIIENIERTPGYLTIRLTINNITGTTLSPQNPLIWWAAAVFAIDGSISVTDPKSNNSILANFTLPPGRADLVSYAVRIATPDNLKGAVLALQGAVYSGWSLSETKCMAFDLSDVQ
jgi:hypothetical protein